MLKEYIAGAVAAALMLPFAVGCSSSQSLVRGQSPDAARVDSGIVQANHQQAAGQPQGSVTPVSHHAAAPCDCENGGGHGGYVTGGNVYYSDCPSDCDGSGNCLGGCLLPGHTHWYSYNAPQNLVYPPANQPAAMIQYPYYTTRGPTDFFMK